MNDLKTKITALIAVVELTENKVGLETLKEIQAEINEHLDLLKSDSVYQALRYAWKSPSSSGVDDCEDSNYQDLYHIVCELRK